MTDAILDPEADEFVEADDAVKDRAWSVARTKPLAFDVATSHDRRRETNALVEEFLARGGEVLRVESGQHNADAGQRTSAVRRRERFRRVWLRIASETSERFPDGFDSSDFRAVARELGHDAWANISTEAILSVCRPGDPFQFVETGARLLFARCGVTIDVEKVAERISKRMGVKFPRRHVPKLMHRPDALSAEARQLIFEMSVAGASAAKIVKRLDAKGFRMKSGVDVTAADVEKFRLREEVAIMIERSRRFGAYAHASVTQPDEAAVKMADSQRG